MHPEPTQVMLFSGRSRDHIELVFSVAHDGHLGQNFAGGGEHVGDATSTHLIIIRTHHSNKTLNLTARATPQRSHTHAG